MSNKIDKETLEAKQMLEDAMPAGTPEEAKSLIRNLTAEVMELTKKLYLVEKELKHAVRRKKAKHDPTTGHVAMVMFSRPKVEGAKVRMHTCDNVQTNQALQTIRTMMRDTDNDFLGVNLLLPMKGKPDAYQRLVSNAEVAWHLFEVLDRDLKIHDPANKEEPTEDPKEE